MRFNSYRFIIGFLPVALIGFYLCGKIKSKDNVLSKLWLLACSIVFYYFNGIKVLLILWLSILVNYIIGRVMTDSTHKKPWLVIGLLFNLGLLGYFKYTNFFLSTIASIMHVTYVTKHIILPLGISFYTFTQMAYLIDVYRGFDKRYSLLSYGLFASFFPQISSGPIMDHQKVIPQFNDQEFTKFHPESFITGVSLFCIGIFKKVVIADYLAGYVDPVFQNLPHTGFIGAWSAAIGFSLELYFDFSGYSDMAYGLGRMFNVTLPINFDAPYQSNSVRDFWRRWHISLGSWIRNYIYIPLGGNRKGEKRKYLNLLISQTLCGLWHGAGMTFVFWGFLHGVYLIINNIWMKYGHKLPTVLARILTFICVVIGWVFFRASTFHDAGIMLLAMIRPMGLQSIQIEGIIPLLVVLTVIVAFVPASQHLVERMNHKQKFVLGGVLAGLLFAFAFLNLGNASSDFIYNRF